MEISIRESRDMDLSYGPEFELKLSAEFELQCADILGPKINLGTKKKADEEPERLRDFLLLQLGSGHAIGGRHLAAILYLHTLLFYC